MCVSDAPKHCVSASANQYLYRLSFFVALLHFAFHFIRVSHFVRPSKSSSSKRVRHDSCSWQGSEILIKKIDKGNDFFLRIIACVLVYTVLYLNGSDDEMLRASEIEAPHYLYMYEMYFWMYLKEQKYTFSYIYCFLCLTRTLHICHEWHCWDDTLKGTKSVGCMM